MVAAGGAGEVEPLGVRAVPLGIASGTGEGDHERVALRDRQTRLDLDVLDGVAQAGHGARRFEAQRLLEGVLPGRPPGADQFELVGVGEEAVHGVVDEVDGRLETRGEQQDQVVHQLLFAEAAFVAGGDEGRRQVVGRVLALVLEERGERAVQLDPVGLGVLQGDRRVEEAVDDAVEGPARTVLAGRYAEEFAHHLVRHRRRERRPQVDDFALRDPLQLVQRPVDDLLDAREQRIDAPLGEGGGHRLAQPAVVGAVGGDHVAHRDPDRERPGAGDVPVDPGRPVLEGVLARFGAGQEPLVQLQAVDPPRSNAAGEFHFDGRALGPDPGYLAVEVLA